MSRPSEKLFADAQSDLFEKSYEENVLEEKSQPVECLGMTFPNDEERRKYFLGILLEKLKDPEFRKSYCQMLCMGLGGDPLFNKSIHKFHSSNNFSEALRVV
jgi:hypothetical protein